MKILLVEDHKMVATSLKESLEKNKDVNVDILENLENVYKTISINNYDIIMIDINLNGMKKKENGLNLSKRLLENFKDIKIIILTGYNLKYYQDIAKEIGCYGFISKEEETESLLNKLYLILEEGEKIFPEAKQKEVDLSPTEIEIVNLYSSGLSRKEVAKKTYMSLRSLAVSLNRIYQKLDVQNYQQMSDKARKLGYINSFE